MNGFGKEKTQTEAISGLFIISPYCYFRVYRKAIQYFCMLGGVMYVSV